VPQILPFLSTKIAGIIITDHDYVNDTNFSIYKKKYGIKIFVGAEISSLDGHILAYGIEEAPSANLSALKTIELIHEQGGIAIAAHPFRILGLDDAIFDLPLDGIEINGSATKKENQRAKEAAMMMDLSTIGGSDSHHKDQLNTYVTRFNVPVNSMNSIQDIVAQIKLKTCKAVRV